MSQIYNVYCDESCHLERDSQAAMIIGAIWCPLDEIKIVSTRIREIKRKHNLSSRFEIKWTKVSPSKKIDFYLDIVDYFFDNDDLHYRCLVVPDKTKLSHDIFEQTHDEWYYKIYFTMLKVILNPKDIYRIYLDIKDTRGGEKVKKLREVLSNSLYDFNRQIVNEMQLIRSHEAELLQLCDLLNGAMGYLNRNLSENKGKIKVIERLQERSGYFLNKSTLYREEKFNIFIWEASQSPK
jgi:hypothetical protein